MPAKEEKITVTRTLPNGEVQEKTMAKMQFALLGNNPGWSHTKARKPKEADADAPEGNPEEPAPGEEFPAETVTPDEADAPKASKKK